MCISHNYQFNSATIRWGALSQWIGMSTIIKVRLRYQKFGRYRMDSFDIEWMPSISKQRSACKFFVGWLKKELLLCFLHKYLCLSVKHVIDRFEGVFLIRYQKNVSISKGFLRYRKNALISKHDFYYRWHP